MTWLGGMVGVPTALRSIESTMTIRVKEVAKISTAGASESTVISTSSCTPEVTCFGSGALGSIVRVTPGASAVAQPLTSRARTVTSSRIRIFLDMGFIP